MAAPALGVGVCGAPPGGGRGVAGVVPQGVQLLGLLAGCSAGIAKGRPCGRPCSGCGVSISRRGLLTRCDISAARLQRLAKPPRGLLDHLRNIALSRAPSLL